MLYTAMDSPLGEILLVGDDRALRGLYMQEGPHPMPVDPRWQRAPARFRALASQLAEYFAGERSQFDVPLALEGSAFQRRVWRALQEIPYGQTTSYGALARQIGAPDASRAVGRANGSNPVGIIVPCHRVIGAGGALTGYGAGLERKRFLLELEAGLARLAV
jgi:methylated-DNA-[protein]-cysteine S-methyltransferase